MSKLVEYSSSDDSEEEGHAVVAKSLVRLPMLLKKVVSEPRASDSPEFHQNKKRAIPHQEGNWATHIFIEGDFGLGELLNEVKEQFHDVLSVKDTHVSLSRLLILKHHWIESFLQTFKNEFRGQELGFQLELDHSENVKFLSNDEKTRYFACVLVNPECRKILAKIILKVDKCLEAFNLPCYYSDRDLIHLSVLWKTIEFTEAEKELITMKFKQFLIDKRPPSLLVDKIMCKTGNKLFAISI